MTNIQDLLGEEYNDFADVILIESPFILVTPHSHIVQLVKAAFTPDKLIIAISTPKEGTYGEGAGAYDKTDYEELELMKLLPLPFLQISVLDRKRKRIQVFFIFFLIFSTFFQHIVNMMFTACLPQHSQNPTRTNRSSGLIRRNSYLLNKQIIIDNS
jgi:hypothetical protein